MRPDFVSAHLCQWYKQNGAISRMGPELTIDTEDRWTSGKLACEAVLAETAFHLQDVGLVLEMIADGLVTLSFDCNDHLPQLAALAARYKDRKPDLADLCLIRMSEYIQNTVSSLSAVRTFAFTAVTSARSSL